MEFKESKHRENLNLIGKYPFGPFGDMVSKESSPLAALRNGPRWQVCRMAMFFMQMVLNLVKSYTPSEEVERRFGLGFQTAPRIALLLHYEESIEGKWKERLCRKRNFFGRALKEGESLKVFKGGKVMSDPDNEWMDHMKDDHRLKIRGLIEQNAEHYLEQDIVSKVDNSKSYENMISHQSWEAGLIYAVHVGCIYH